MKVKDVLNRVTALYNDAEFVRLSKNQYLQFLDDSLNQLVSIRPDCYVVIETVKLRPGNRQVIPADAYSLVDIYSNAVPQSDGSFSYGPPVYQVERKDMDYYSNWYKSYMASSGVIMDFMYDRKTPRTFFVYPAVPTAKEVYVEMAVSKQPPEYASLSNTFEEVLDMELPVTSTFKSALVNYMLYLVYGTDSTSVNDRQVSVMYEQSFYRNLGQEYNASVLNMPKIIEPPVNTGEGVGGSTDGQPR